MLAPVFTVLMPIIRPPDLMRFAIASLQKQTLTEFELLIVGDGAPAETIEAAKEIAAKDPRIKVYFFPKGERNGEAHRHQVLKEARGQYICHLCDDDLWFPEHLETMRTLLEKVEFGHTLHSLVNANDTVSMFLADLADPLVQKRLKTEHWNFFGHTVGGYRTETYRRLPVGWSPAPADLWPDLYMWRKFLALDGISAGTSFKVTSVHFASPVRKKWSMDKRRSEIKRYSSLISTPEGRAHYTEQAFKGIAKSQTRR
jgi:glycosyltransferase involved in cell wall biosynthesis